MAPARSVGAALWEAARHGKLEDLKKCLGRIGNDISLKPMLEFRHPIEGTTPLLAATLHKHEAALLLLVEAGARVHATTRTKKKSTPLHVAAYYGYDTIVRLLIQHGADVYRQNALGLLPLDVARFKVQIACVDALLHAMEVYQAPMSYRNASKVFKSWRRCFVRLLRVSGEKAPPLYELAFYPTKDSVCPIKVAWFSPNVSVLEANPDHAMELRFAPAAIWVPYRPSTFTRDVGNLPRAKQQPRAFRLLVESAAAVQEWCNIGTVVAAQSRHGTTAADVFVPTARNPYADGIAKFMAASLVAETKQQVHATMSRSTPISPDSNSANPASNPASPASIDTPSSPAFSLSPACEPPSPVISHRPSPTLHLPLNFDKLAIGPMVAQAMPASAPSFSEPMAPPSAPPLGEKLPLHVRGPPPSYRQAIASHTNEGAECIICLDAPKNCVTLPCRHLACCSRCLAQGVSLCPVCRAPIESVLQVFT
ncbi:hypothetical protein SPRG_05618 [Saprolegnia parasitica CBS 223.65]|uniref:RING-type domain-containing protein n=1 Tax=Saprolegnia parasitica (strain CBS 223.65) TaxID=695850 RepID=A0A067CT41_SAPPC|nr:hypothetical protein SPRG_05618 [Saprolegnia parasitica CBS 223.65]KDO29666.1 hypothetical protein SPRG_05618 [Saprolegnia parasitica CBS 223.65]|eukprot:XP_012199724.1 hypothetical protein SPRG_05618 [Saprolegnia parasitica CBS 223.65]